MDTDEIVRQAMEEEKQRKEAKSKAKGDGRQYRELKLNLMSFLHHSTTQAQGQDTGGDRGGGRRSRQAEHGTHGPRQTRQEAQGPQRCW